MDRQRRRTSARASSRNAAYIDRFTDTEQLRSGLRALACHLHTKLRSSVALHEATAVLHAGPAGLAPDQVDDMLACRLLHVERHRVRFQHELLGQFLAAEDLVRSATSSAELARALGSPANGVLAGAALAVEPDPRKVWAVLDELASTTLMRAAHTGDFCERVDRTDAVCLHQARLLKADGSDSPISTVVANSYNQVHPADGRALAASYVVAGFEFASMMRRWGPDGTVAGVARRFAAADGQYPWGRLYPAALSVHPDDPADQAEFSRLLRRAWDAGGYHLHLERPVHRVLPPTPDVLVGEPVDRVVDMGERPPRTTSRVTTTVTAADRPRPRSHRVRTPYTFPARAA